MKYVDEFRDPAKAKVLLKEINQLANTIKEQNLIPTNARFTSWRSAAATPTRSFVTVSKPCCPIPSN